MWSTGKHWLQGESIGQEKASWRAACCLQELFLQRKNDKIKRTYSLRFTTLRKHFCNIEAVNNNIKRRTGVYKVLKSLQFLKRQSETGHQQELRGWGRGSVGGELVCYAWSLGCDPQHCTSQVCHSTPEKWRRGAESSRSACQTSPAWDMEDPASEQTNLKTARPEN